jgi:hypothetical protein
MAKTFETYAAELAKLIENAREAIIANDDGQMKACHRALGEFIASSSDTIVGVIELDNVASTAMRDLTLARLDRSLVGNLSERAADVARLVKAFRAGAAANASAASALRLERTKAVLDATTTAVDELKKLADVIDTADPDGRKLSKALADSIDAIVAVQRQLS